MGIPPRIQQIFDKMLHARSHIELAKAYQESASEIIRVRNSGSYNDDAMHELFQAHNAIYTKMAQRFPCAPQTTREFVMLESILLQSNNSWGWDRGWLEWHLNGGPNMKFRGRYGSPTIPQRKAVAPILQRWVHCEYIKPDGRGGYKIGEEGRRLEAALKIGGRFNNVEDVYRFTSMDDLR